jgi:hypothetical protein
LRIGFLKELEMSLFSFFRKSIGMNQCKQKESKESNRLLKEADALLKMSLENRQTDELLKIWGENDRGKYSEESFCVIKQILERRGQCVIPQNGKKLKHKQRPAADSMGRKKNTHNAGSFYTNVFCNFSLDHPTNWQLEFENRGVAGSPWTEAARFAGPMGSVVRPYLTVVTGLVENDGKSIGAYMDKAENDLRNGFSNFRILSKREDTLLGWPAAWMTYTYQADSGSRQEMNVTIFFGKQQWQVWFQFICETDVRQSSSDFLLFEHIVRSLRINSGGLRLDSNLVGMQCEKCRRPGSAGNYQRPVFDSTDGVVKPVCDACWKGV